MNPTEPELICKVIPENRKKKFHNGCGVLRVTDLVVR